MLGLKHEGSRGSRRKEYVSLSLSTGQLSKALDMDREHRYATLVEVPPIPSRPSARVLASIGERGVFLEIEEGKLGHLPEVRRPGCAG